MGQLTCCLFNSLSSAFNTRSSSPSVSASFWHIEILSLASETRCSMARLAVGSTGKVDWSGRGLDWIRLLTGREVEISGASEFSRHVLGELFAIPRAHDLVHSITSSITTSPSSRHGIHSTIRVDSRCIESNGLHKVSEVSANEGIQSLPYDVADIHAARKYVGLGDNRHIVSHIHQNPTTEATRKGIRFLDEPREKSITPLGHSSAGA